jgi:energy-coupling factor transporter ATP-binding protein EcfA2
MAVPVRCSDLLSAFVRDCTHPAWARDLVCLAIQTGGVFTETERALIWEECENSVASPSLAIPASIGAPYPKVLIDKITHHHGVNALADNQEISFCEEGITLLYGQNRSGKSGYFRLLNNLSAGRVSYPIHHNIYQSAPSPVSVTIDYKLDGIPFVFHWDGKAACPKELRHIRCFDSHYAETFLKPRSGDTYLFDSYSLRVFQAIHETLRFLKEDMGVVIDATTESSLKTLCTTSYRDMLSNALLDGFRQELSVLGLGSIGVDLIVGDLLLEASQIEIQLFNRMDLSEVLSEAELKCAALALFLAECELMAVPQPIVFDDPVTSLDAGFIQAFTNRLRNLDTEIVVFTHNILFMEALTDERQFKVYGSPSTSRIGATTAKKHVLAYEVMTSANSVGFVIGRVEKKTLFYLEKAQEKLSASPVTDIKGIVDDLRMAIEWAIDEVVFWGLPTRRFKGSEVTDWVTMENMANAGPQNVRDLKANYDTLSGVGVHLGFSSYAAPPSPATLQLIHDEVLRIYRTVNP